MADPFVPEARKGYTEVPFEGSTRSTNIFVRYLDQKPAGKPKVPTVEIGHVKVKEELIDSRGSSAFQLFLSFHLDPRGNGRFDFAVAEAQVDARIRVRPKSSFDALEDFGGIYEKFAATATFDKGWRAAADKFAEAHITCHDAQRLPDGSTRGGHWATTFTGIRAKTMRHEMDHVRFAVRECDGLVGNFLTEVRKVGNSSDGSRTPRQRVDRVAADLMGRFGFPYFDVGAQEHKKIAMRDCFFMVAWYQRQVLKQPVIDNAAFEVEIEVLYDWQYSNAMKQLGEGYPWL
jgi:hypothetical protein